MSATKPWAYVTEFGPERVDAWEIKRQRDRIGGASLEMYWWSPHRKGERKRVTHTDRKGAVPHFTYIDSWPAGDGDGDGGETLSHVLYKNAIARLAKTQLRFPNGEVHDIRITHAEFEKTVPLAVGHRVVDVYCRFESDSHLAKKWGGEVCFEVWHTHRAPKAKILGMRENRIPVFEVPIPRLFQYRHEHNTSRVREKAHEDFLVGRLGEYMLGKAISDPCSAEYLEEQVQVMTAQMARDAKLAAARSAEVTTLQSEIATLKGTNASAAAQNTRMASQIALLTTERTLLKKAATEHADTITRLGGTNDSLAKDIVALHEELKYRKYLLIAMGVALVICMACMLYISFIGWRSITNPESQGTSNEPPSMSSEKLPDRTNALPKPNEGKPVKHKAPAKKIIKKEPPVTEMRPDSAEATSPP